MMDRLIVFAFAVGLMLASGFAARLVRSEMLADLESALPERDIKAQVKWYPDETAGLTKLHHIHFAASSLGQVWNILIAMTAACVFLLGIIGSFFFPKVF